MCWYFPLHIFKRLQFTLVLVGSFNGLNFWQLYWSTGPGQDAQLTDSQNEMECLAFLSSFILLFLTSCFGFYIYNCRLCSTTPWQFNIFLVSLLNTEVKLHESPFNGKGLRSIAQFSKNYQMEHLCEYQLYLQTPKHNIPNRNQTCVSFQM